MKRKVSWRGPRPELGCRARGKKKTPVLTKANIQLEREFESKICEILSLGYKAMSVLLDLAVLKNKILGPSGTVR
jgi:hypothetical protein